MSDITISRRTLALAGVVLLVLLAAGVGTWALLTRSDGLTVEGTLTLTTDSDGIATVNLSTECAGRGGYADIREGAAVTVTGPSGQVLGVGHLGKGRSTSQYSCRFPFTVSVSPGQGFYGIEVARRGKVQYAEGDLAGPLALTLG